MAMPSRVRNSKMRRPIASATAVTIVAKRCHVSTTSPILNPCPLNSGGSECACYLDRNIDRFAQLHSPACEPLTQCLAFD